MVLASRVDPKINVKMFSSTAAFLSTIGAIDLTQVGGVLVKARTVQDLAPAVKRGKPLVSKVV